MFALTEDDKMHSTQSLRRPESRDPGSRGLTASRCLRGRSDGDEGPDRPAWGQGARERGLLPAHVGV